MRRKINQARLKPQGRPPPAASPRVCHSTNSQSSVAQARDNAASSSQVRRGNVRSLHVILVISLTQTLCCHNHSSVGRRRVKGTGGAISASPHLASEAFLNSERYRSARVDNGVPSVGSAPCDTRKPRNAVSQVLTAPVIMPLLELRCEYGARSTKTLTTGSLWEIQRSARVCDSNWGESQAWLGVTARRG